MSGQFAVSKKTDAPTCYNLSMNAAEAKAYKDRWKEVEEIKSQETQSDTIENRWRQLNALKTRALRLGISRKGKEDKTEIYRLWAKLRNAHAPTR